jgi:predicted enzyme related to lactoylglutathione lyase
MNGRYRSKDGVVARGLARRGLTRLSVGALLSVALVAVAAAASFVLPPLVQPASSERHAGKVIWADLVTPDLAAAKRFYGALFGWSFNDIHTGASDYSVALLDGRPVGGLYQHALRSGEQRQPAWLTFISVRDVAEAEHSILAHGGKLLAPPRLYAERGRQAVFADPQGAVFAVLQSSSGDPEDVLAAPGEWIWSSVLTRDPDQDAAFYQNVFGYEVFDMPGEDGAMHIVLSSEDVARASLNTLPAGGAAKRHPHWLNFVRVTSATDTVARVESLGGRVLVQPFRDRHGGLVAVVADPAGAPFGLLEWTDTDSKDTAK